MLKAMAVMGLGTPTAPITCQEQEQTLPVGLDVQEDG